MRVVRTASSPESTVRRRSVCVITRTTRIVATLPRGFLRSVRPGRAEVVATSPAVARHLESPAACRLRADCDPGALPRGRGNASGRRCPPAREVSDVGGLQHLGLSRSGRRAEAARRVSNRGARRQRRVRLRRQLGSGDSGAARAAARGASLRPAGRFAWSTSPTTTKAPTRSRSPMRDYAYLNSDLVFLYEGYNDLMGDPQRAQRLDLPARIAGVPADRLPADLSDRLQGKGGGDAVRRRRRRALSARRTRPCFGRTSRRRRPPACCVRPRRSDSRSSVSSAAPRQSPRIESDEVDATGCKHPWEQYCQAIADGVRTALAADRQVIVVIAAVRARRVPPPAARGAAARGGGDAAPHVRRRSARRLRRPRRHGRSRRSRAVVRSHASDGRRAISRLAEHLVGPVVEMASRRMAVPSAQH